MIDYYLKFSDEETANSVLFTLVDDEEVANYQNISIIGVIVKDEVALEGWHVNVRADASPELEQYQVFPLVPMRVWA